MENVAIEMVKAFVKDTIKRFQRWLVNSVEERMEEFKNEAALEPLKSDYAIVEIVPKQED